VNTEEIEYPDGWVMSTLAEVAQIVKDKVDPAVVADSYYIGLEHIEAHTMRILGSGRGRDVKSTKIRFLAGDVLYGKLRPYLNKVAQPDFDGICSTDFLVFRESEQIDAGYLAQFLNQLWIAERAHHLSAGVELPRVDWKGLSSFAISYPSSKQSQRAIVRSIEDARASVGSASTHLADSKRAVERFRQAVLAAACSGRLTADWRQQNSDPSSVILALSELRSQRKERKQREQAVSLPLPELPETYVLASLGESAVMLEYGTSKKCATDPTIGVPVLRMGNIQDGKLDFSDLKYCSVDDEIIRLMLEPGDLLFNRTNSPELVGKSAVYQSDVPASFASYLIRVRFDNRVALPEFVNYWLNSAWGRAWAQLAKTDGVSQSNINGSKLALMAVPLPPIDEQAVIVERASQMLMVADAIHARIESASSAVDKSSQAVLAKAFRGQLALAAAV
jgi:type I restriction enzyme S subunit